MNSISSTLIHTGRVSQALASPLASLTTGVRKISASVSSSEKNWVRRKMRQVP
jgi:hypothetical protein